MAFWISSGIDIQKICIVNHDKNAKNLAVDKNESFAGVIILRGQVYNASCKMKHV